MIDDSALLKAFCKVLDRAAAKNPEPQEGDDFASGIGFGVADPSTPSSGLWPEEQAATNRMVPARLREFSAGRKAARSAMAGIGVQELPVPMAPDRSPVWPAGLIGSISHCEGICMAAVARQGKVAAVGIDVERDVPLPDALYETILLPEERVWLNTQPISERGRIATLIFSMKESAFKAQYFLSGQMFGFEGLAVSPDPEAQTFVATFRTWASPFGPGDHVQGSFGTEQSLVLTAVVIPG